MKILGTISIGFLLMSTALYCFSEVRKTTPNENSQKVKTMNGAEIYKNNFKTFNYYIESIGTVSIDNVDLDKGKLTALYSYKQGSENRQVVSALTLDDDGIYKGTCTTKVNGKFLLAVNTWLLFKQDGTASGNWSWSGEPSKKDPVVTVSK